MSGTTSFGGGTPGGSTTQLQRNNAGAFGGISGWTSNGTTTLTGGASTTLAVGGATIGTNALAVTGTVAISGAATFGAGTVSLPGVAVGEASTGLYQTASGKLSLAVLGVKKLDYNETSTNAWFFNANVRIGAGGSFTIADSGGANGLQLIGQSGSDCIIGSLGATSPLNFRTNSTTRMLINDTLAVFGASAAATSSFPALKRSATVLQARLGDDSAFAPLQGLLRTAANAVNETITPTHTLIITDASGQAYRVGGQV